MPQGAGERTEKATQKRREEARKQGYILKSREVSTAAALLIMLGSLKMLGGRAAERAISEAEYIFSGAAGFGGTGADVAAILARQAAGIIAITAPFLAVAFISCALVNIVQQGFYFNTALLAPRMDRLNPLEGLRGIFNRRTLYAAALNLLKIAVIGWILYNEIRKNATLILSFTGKDTVASAVKAFDLILSLGFKLGMALAVIAAADYLMMWRWYEKDLMMTRQEIREEYRETEGNPEQKSAIRRKQREISNKRMLSGISAARMVICDETNYAVALKYDDGGSSAPTVLAKGKEQIAQRIRSAAEEHAVTIVENKPLARALYRLCENGDYVPEQLYDTVAGALAVVMQAEAEDGE